jgi:Tol biopolymer transport system component
MLAYVAGSSFDQELVWVDRKGGEVDRIADPGDYISLRISPLGTHAALSRSDPQSGWPAVWNLDVARGAMYPVAPATVDWFPVWSANGAAILFASASSKGESGMTLKSAPAAGGVPKPLRSIDGPVFPSDWSADGSWLAYTGYSRAKRAGVWLARISHNEVGVPWAFIDSEHNEGGAVFSPASGRREPSWLAYTSDESGRDEVYVQSFPKPGTKIKISMAGGSRPLWHWDGRELYFLDPRGMLMMARIRDADRMHIDLPVELFRIATPPPDKPPYTLNYATWDGSRFLVRRTRIESESRSLAIMNHWAPVHR